MHRNYRLPMMVVTHDIDDAAALATHLVALKDGQVVARGKFRGGQPAPEFQALLDCTRYRQPPCRRSHCAVPTAASRSGFAPIRCCWPTEEPHAVSARNVLAGTVRAVIAESEQSRLVELDDGAGLVISRVTPDAVDELGLEPGKRLGLW